MRCEELINSFNIKEEEKTSMLSELTYPNMLCPNITSFKVNGDILTNDYLELSVDIKKGANNA